jgi:hypothetical protein
LVFIEDMPTINPERTLVTSTLVFADPSILANSRSIPELA